MDGPRGPAWGSDAADETHLVRDTERELELVAGGGGSLGVGPGEERGGLSGDGSSSEHDEGRRKEGRKEGKKVGSWVGVKEQGAQRGRAQKSKRAREMARTHAAALPTLSLPSAPSKALDGSWIAQDQPARAATRCVLCCLCFVRELGLVRAPPPARPVG